MFTARNYARSLFTYYQRTAANCQQCRWASGNRSDQLQATSPTAERLSATGLWSYGRWGKKNPKPKGDKSRVNIVEEKLCGRTLRIVASNPLPVYERYVVFFRADVTRLSQTMS